MCEVATIGLAISAVSAVVGGVAQAQQNIATKKMLQYDTNMAQEQARLQKEQIGDQAAAAMSQRQREAMIERARLRVAAGEAGLNYMSLAPLERASMMNEVMDLSTIAGNRDKASKQVALEAMSRSTKNAMSSAALPSNAMLFTKAGLQIAGDYTAGAARNGGQANPLMWTK